MNKGQIALTIYTLFAVITFLKASEYWYASLYFVVAVVIWFKLKRRLRNESRNN